MLGSNRLFSLLLYTTIVLPLRMAYLDDSARVWEILDWILNALFIVDIFVNLFSAYFDNDLNLIVDRKVCRLLLVATNETI